MQNARRLLFRILTFFFLIGVGLVYAQAPLRLVTVAPCRLVDTRPQNGGGGPITAGSFQTFNLPSLAELGKFCPAFSLASAAAYSLNVTLVTINSAPVGYLTIWPTGEAQPVVSLTNSEDGRIKANAAIVPAGTNGAVNVYVTSTTNVLLDINAYFDSASNNSALAFFPLQPCRVVDTRSRNAPPLQGGVERDFLIPGVCGIPSTAQAFAFNFTVVPINNGPIGYLSVWPAGAARPLVSTLNDLTGTIVANAGIVPAGTRQETAVYSTNDANLLIDVNGYFAPATGGLNSLSLYTLVPCRVLDTRKTIGLFNGTIPVGIVGSSCGIPNVANAFVLNATVVPPAELGFLTLWPEGQIMPVASTLNSLDGTITSNMAIVFRGLGNDSIDAYVDANTQLILDISSYFGPIASVNVLTSALPNGTAHQNYSVPLVATGGVAPYTWRLFSGSLPSGMNPLSSGGLISGTPTANGGPFVFTVQATDAQLNVAYATLSLTVNESAGTLSVATTSLPTATLNTPYNSLLGATGGITPYSWSIASSSLPAGLSLNSSTGLVNGTPGAAGITAFTVKVTDALRNTATQNLTIPVNTGDANGTLNGNYAFSFSGYRASDPFAWAGAFIADGNGNIIGGVYDINQASGVRTEVPFTGSYSIQANGIGQITLNSSLGTDTLAIATGASDEMRIIYANQNGSMGVWGSGAIKQQNPAIFNTAAFAGNWALGYQGVDPSGHATAAAGSYQEDPQGNITNGVQDINDFGTMHIDTSFTANPVGSLNTTYGRVTSQIHILGETATNAVYAISANEKLFIGIDSGGALYTGRNLRQSGTFTEGTLNGVGVFSSSRVDNSESDAVVGLIAANGGGNLTILQDENNNGTTFHGMTQMGTYSVASNGRSVLSLADGSKLYCYLAGQNQCFIVNTTAGASLAYLEPQSGAPFSDASWTGEFLGGTLPLAAPGLFDQIDSISVDGNGNFSSTYDQSGPNGSNLNQTLAATYSIDSAGEITISQRGSAIYYGFVVSPTKMEAISLDDNPRTSVEVQSSAPQRP